MGKLQLYSFQKRSSVLLAISGQLLAGRVSFWWNPYGCSEPPDLLAGRWKQRSQRYSDRLLKSIQFRFETTSSNRHADRRRFHCLSRCDRTCMERRVRIWLQMGFRMDARYSGIFSDWTRISKSWLSQTNILYGVFLEWTLYARILSWWSCTWQGNDLTEDVWGLWR